MAVCSSVGYPAGIRAEDIQRRVSVSRTSIMSDTAKQLLAAFEALPPNEQHELLVAMLRRSGELQSAANTDDDLRGVADELFQTLDASESPDIDNGSR